MRCVAWLVVPAIAGCFGGGGGGGGSATGAAGASGATTDEERIAEAQTALGEVSDEANALATEYDEQVTRAQSDASYDVEAALAFLEAVPAHFTRMAAQAEVLQRLVDEQTAADLARTSAALEEPGADCELQAGGGFWAHLRSFASNLLGGPVAADNLYTAAQETDKVKQRFKDKWQPRIDACNKLRGAERDLCIATVDQDSRVDFAQAASDVAESGSFAVIKAVGAGVVGIGIGAGAAALSVPALGAVALGAVGTVIAEDVIDYVFRPAPAADAGPAAAPVAVVRVKSSAGGTQVGLPAGRYEVLARPRGGQASLRTVTVSSGATTMVAADCGTAAKPDAGVPSSPDAGATRKCDRADQVVNPENGLCVCPPQKMDYDNRCLPFTCTDSTYDPTINDCACGGFTIPTVTQQNGMLLVTCSGF